MKALAVTGVWSLCFRRPRRGISAPEMHVVDTFAILARLNQILLIGPIRQELLSGIRMPAHFRKLQRALAAFPLIPILFEDYDKAAELYNTCRRHAIAGDHTDYLLCAVSLRVGCSVLTVDEDFQRCARHLPITLLSNSAWPERSTTTMAGHDQCGGGSCSASSELVRV